MVYQFLLFCILLFNFHLCQGDETESQMKGSKYAIIKPTGFISSTGIFIEYPPFLESVFEKRLTNGKWRYQSLLEDNSTGYCGYFKEENSKRKQIDTYFVKSVLSGADKLKYVSTRIGGSTSMDIAEVLKTPVPGKVKLILTDPLTSHYSGLYTITRLLYNGFQQYQKTQDGPRMYVNIYNQWVIGTWDHTDKIIMNQVEASPNFTNTWPGWNMSLKHVKEEDSVLTLNTEMELLKRSGQPPECIIQNFKYNIEEDLFKLTTNGTYRLPDLAIGKGGHERFYARQSNGLWAQNLVNDFIGVEGPYLRTSESSTIIPRSGWGRRDKYLERLYEPDHDSSVIGSPCTINLRFNFPSVFVYDGTYEIENKLENDHPVYTKDSKFSLYVNPSKKWVLGSIVENQSGAKEKEDLVIISQDFSTTPLTWLEWFNSGTQQNPVLTPRQV